MNKSQTDKTINEVIEEPIQPTRFSKKFTDKKKFIKSVMNLGNQNVNTKEN